MVANASGKKEPPEVVAETRIAREPGYIYMLDRRGDVMRMNKDLIPDDD
jgi:hypothetical protein